MNLPAFISEYFLQKYKVNICEKSASNEIIGQVLNNGLYLVLEQISDGCFSRTFLVEDTFSCTK